MWGSGGTLNEICFYSTRVNLGGLRKPWQGQPCGESNDDNNGARGNESGTILRERGKFECIVGKQYPGVHHHWVTVFNLHKHVYSRIFEIIQQLAVSFLMFLAPRQEFLLR